MAAVLDRLKGMGDPAGVRGMARFGIATDRAYGIRIPKLRKLARELGTDHDLAQDLWQTGVHEARIFASMIDDPKAVTESQMEAWVADFNSWDLCDQCCGNLFDKTSFAWAKTVEWAGRDEEFVKRTAFSLMANLALHDRAASNDGFVALFPLIVREARDERNYVKKAVNWALRQIGKRNRVLNGKAIETAEEIRQIDSRSARWIAADALRELHSEAVQRRLSS